MDPKDHIETVQGRFRDTGAGFPVVLSYEEAKAVTEALKAAETLKRDKEALIQQLTSAVHKLAEVRAVVRESFEEQGGIRHSLDMD